MQRIFEIQNKMSQVFKLMGEIEQIVNEAKENEDTETTLIAEHLTRTLKSTIENFIKEIDHFNYENILKFGLKKVEINGIVFTLIEQKRDNIDWKEIWKTLSSIGKSKEDFKVGEITIRYVKSYKPKKK